MSSQLQSPQYMNEEPQQVESGAGAMQPAGAGGMTLDTGLQAIGTFKIYLGLVTGVIMLVGLLAFLIFVLVHDSKYKRIRATIVDSKKDCKREVQYTFDHKVYKDYFEESNCRLKDKAINDHVDIAIQPKHPNKPLDDYFVIHQTLLIVIVAILMILVIVGLILNWFLRNNHTWRRIQGVFGMFDMTQGAFRGKKVPTTPSMFYKTAKVQRVLQPLQSSLRRR